MFMYPKKNTVFHVFLFAEKTLAKIQNISKKRLLNVKKR